MNVNVKLFAGLRDFAPTSDGICPVDLPDGATIDDVYELLSIPPDKPSIILVNGRHAGRDHILMDGDTLSLFPPVAGG
jgi:molybdopterin converting factor small subunit